MTIPEALLILIIAGIIAYLIHYFFQGSSGNISIRQPVESRVDEYLDRKYKTLIDEWALVRKSGFEQFKTHRNDILNQDEERIQTLKAYEKDLCETLQDLEHRLDLLERQKDKIK